MGHGDLNYVDETLCCVYHYRFPSFQFLGLGQVKCVCVLYAACIRV